MASNIEERIESFKRYQNEIKNFDMFADYDISIKNQGTSSNAYHKENYRFDADTALGVDNLGINTVTIDNAGWTAIDTCKTAIHADEFSLNGKSFEEMFDELFNKKINDKYTFDENNIYHIDILDEDMLI